MARSYRAANRGHLVYLFALPLLPAFFTVVGHRDLGRIGWYGGALAGFFLAAYLIRIGVKKQHRASFSRYRRLWTHAWVGVGGMLAAVTCFGCQYFLINNSFSFACMIGLTAFVGVWLCYGAVRSEIELSGAVGYSASEIAKELAKAEDQLFVIGNVGAQLEPGDIQQRLKRIERKSRNVLRQIEADPADLRRARKFLSVFLPGTSDVCQTYWKVHQSGTTDRFERRFRSTLADVEALVNKQIQKLKDNEEFDLDVQMEVLVKQIHEEP